MINLKLEVPADSTAPELLFRMMSTPELLPWRTNICDDVTLIARPYPVELLVEPLLTTISSPGEYPALALTHLATTWTNFGTPPSPCDTVINPPADIAFSPDV
ncbi:MAG: hypothetical protein HQL69_20855 [Magnetococcales bacterium]|nr:hypothetical protein [Magnetococcales bacterium]